MPSAPIGFTSAGNLSTTVQPASMNPYAAHTAAAAAAQAATPGITSGTHYDGYDAAVLAAG